MNERIFSIRVTKKLGHNNIYSPNTPLLRYLFGFLSKSNWRKKSIIFICFLFFGCAAVSPPPGGPVDKTPPSLITVDPPSGTSKIEGKFSVDLIFSERLDESTLEKSFRIAPISDEPLEIKMKREVVTIIFPEKLNSDQTYILTVSRDLMDERKNRLDQTYQLAFSTGEDIARGEIRGKVYNPFKGASTVFLYKINGRELDSLFTVDPDYYTETDDSGYYHFSFIDSGAYQILSIGSSVGLTSLIPSRMPYGVHWNAPLMITSPTDTLSYIDMRVHKEPVLLNVLKATIETQYRGVIRFTNFVSLKKQVGFSLLLYSLDNGDTIVPDLIHQYENNSNEIYFHSSQLESGAEYTLSISNVVDSLDQQLQAYETKITVPPEDTLAAEIIYPRMRSTTSINLDRSLKIQFSAMMTHTDADTIITIKDKSDNYLAPDLEWDNPTRLFIKPEQGWESGKKYKVTLFGYNFLDPRGKSLEDSIIVFNVIGRETGFGGLSGTVHWQYSDGAVIVAKSTENSTKFYSVDVHSKGNFGFKLLPSGFWQLSIYQDVNDNNRYDFGMAIPFERSEPFFEFPDTIEVRTNWDIEGMELEIKKD